jgi:very-short-patch-repair endonuclease
MNWTLSHIENLKKTGKIKGYSADNKIQREQPGRIVAKHFKKQSKEKDWIGLVLLGWCSERGLRLMEEYKFDENRRWRADYAIPEKNVLIEYEGLFSEKSRHTTAKGFTGDTEKYSAASLSGWTVLRFTALNYRTLPAALNKIK